MKSLLMILSAMTSFTSTIALADACDGANIASLKEQVRAIAKQNIGDRTNLPAVRAKLNPLADQLSKCHTPASAEADLPALVGAWKEIFSDDVEPEPPGFSIDRDGTYQVISDKGYFYNLANEVGFVTLTGVLRGVYTPADNFLNIEFTKVSVKFGGLNETKNLIDFVEEVEAGNIRTIGIPGGGRFPKGPVGAKGNLRNIYIDQDFRISTGSNLADGRVDIYVLDRVTTPIRYK